MRDLQAPHEFTCYHKYVQQACQHTVVILVVPSASFRSAEDLPSQVNSQCNEMLSII